MVEIIIKTLYKKFSSLGLSEKGGSGGELFGGKDVNLQREEDRVKRAINTSL